MRARRLDRVAVVEVSSTSHEVHRTPALIAQSNQRYFKLNLQLQGTGLLIQDNREALLRPGDLSIYDTSRPYTLAFEGDARLMVVMFPWDALSGPSGSRLATNALDLVSTMLHSELDMSPDRMRPQALLAASVREYIDANLADPLLSPASIAAAHFISTRHLHNVFHESGTTVASWIRTQRLEGARRELRDPLLAGMPVGAVAGRWGFLDAAHFSRSFRDAFGESPSDWRRGA
jgi:AraC-like DNA-binding protein